MIKMYIDLYVNCSLFLSIVNKTWIFWADFQQNLNVKFHENRPVEAKFHADRQTDMAKLKVAFRNFGNAPKIAWMSLFVRMHVLLYYCTIVLLYYCNRIGRNLIDFAVCTLGRTEWSCDLRLVLSSNALTWEMWLQFLLRYEHVCSPLCVCFLCRLWPCDGPITRPRRPRNILTEDSETREKTGLGSHCPEGRYIN